MSLGWAYSLLGSSTEVSTNDSSPIHRGIIFVTPIGSALRTGGDDEMDELATTGWGRPFDELASGLASGTITRGRALKLAGAALLGMAGGLGVAAREAEAAPPPTCPPDTRTGCVVACTNTTKQCACITTTEGDRVCVNKCCSLRSCSSSSQCRRGEVCIRTGCCREGIQRCVTRCSEPIPRYCVSR